MKNKLFKFYITAMFFCSTIILFAQPGEGSSGGDLEAEDPPVPIGDYVWILAVVGLLFVFMKLRAMHKAKIQG
jgi:hypothetical protein